MPRRAVVLAALVLSGIGSGVFNLACGAGQKTVLAPSDEIHDATPLTPDTSPIGLRRSLVADEYFWLRAKALEGEVPAPFAEALTAMKDIRSELASDTTSWEDLEVPLGTVRRANELSQAYADLPPMKDVGGKPVAFRAHALRLARAMEASEAAYRSGPFREHDVEIVRAAKELQARLMPNVETILRAVESDMSLPGVSRPIMVTLVGDAPYESIFAADARGRVTASFVRVQGASGITLCETLLRESLHAIDELTVRMPTAMNMLRSALGRRGIDESEVEMAVNTITFAEAASLVRRFIEPHHPPTGEQRFQALYPPAAAISRAWNRHIEGASLDVTTEAVAEAVTHAGDGSSAPP